MRTLLVAGALLLLAALDGAFSGFRASAGRTGLIRHLRQDISGAIRGLATVSALLTPVVAFAVLDVSTDAARPPAYVRAGEAMLAAYVPYATLALAALGCYTVLGWRHRFLAGAIILGPFTLARPAVALVGAGAGAWASQSTLAASLAGAAAIAVLAVAPVASRLWYAGSPAPAPASHSSPGSAA